MNIAPLSIVLAFCAFASTAFADDLPLTLGSTAGTSAVRDDDKDEKTSEFSIGPVAGFIKIRDADEGTWFGGVQARYRFAKILAIEGSITFHQDEFADGDVVVTQYPVQVTALLFPFPHSSIQPYGLIGAGWYYTRVDVDTPLFEGDDTDNLFGVHLGAGLQVELGPHVAIFADFRWIFMDEPATDNGDLDEEEFDSGQVTLGASFRF